jgi:hypothetical protein
VRGVRVPLEEMFGKLRIRDRLIDVWASIRWRASSSEERSGQ